MVVLNQSLALFVSSVTAILASKLLWKASGLVSG